MKPSGKFELKGPLTFFHLKHATSSWTITFTPSAETTLIEKSHDDGNVQWSCISLIPTQQWCMCQVKFVDLHHRLICPQSLNFTAWSFNNSSINQLPFLFDLNVEHYFKRLDLWYFCHRLYREWCPVDQLNGGINRQCKSRLDKQSKSSLGNSGRLSPKKFRVYLTHAHITTKNSACSMHTGRWPWNVPSDEVPVYRHQ